MAIKSFFTSFFDSFADSNSTFDFRNELRSHLVEKTYKNDLRDKVSFDAVILHVNEKTPQTSTHKEGMQYVAKVRPLDLHRFILPEPCAFGNKQSLVKYIVSLHPTAYSNHHSADISLTVGDIVECYYDGKGPSSHGQMRGLRFEHKIKSRAPGNYSYGCLGLDASESTQNSHDRRYYPSTALGSPTSVSKTGTAIRSDPNYDATLADVSFTGHAGVMGIIDGVLPENELVCSKFPWVKGSKGKPKYYPTAWCKPAVGTELQSTSNFMKIKHDTLNNYRSAVPANDMNFFRFLKKEHKIERVISLCLLSAYANKHKSKKNGFPNRKGGLDPNLSREAAEAGIEYLYTPLTTNGPSKSNWEKMKVFLNKGNTLIHCTHGADRTGAIAGRWMVEKYGISAKEAYKDALKHGFKPYMYAYTKDRPDANRALRYFIFTGKSKRWSSFKKQQPEYWNQQ